MEDKNKTVEKLSKAAKLGSGAMLAEARKRQDKSIDEIAEELNLSVTQIRTIESDQSEGLPEPTYVRGYIRSYAKLLGLNPEDVLQHYLNKNWQKSPNLDEMPRGIGDADSTESGLLSPARVIVFLVISGLLLFFWFKGGFDGIFGGDAQESSVPETIIGSTEADSAEINRTGTNSTDANSVNAQTAPETFEATGQAAVASSSANSVSELEDEAVAVESNPAGTSLQANVPGENRIILTFTETSWVDIRDEQQNRLAYQSYPRGETLDVAAKGVLSVLIGNAKGVEMTLNGQPYDLSEYTEGVYAKFTVGEPQ